MEDEYGHSRVTTAWILRPAGGLVEGSSSWIGIVVDMVIIIEDGSWSVHCSRYFKACRRHSFQESHLQLREEAKLLTRRKGKGRERDVQTVTSSQKAHISSSHTLRLPSHLHPRSSPRKAVSLSAKSEKRPVHYLLSRTTKPRSSPPSRPFPLLLFIPHPS